MSPEARGASRTGLLVLALLLLLTFLQGLRGTSGLAGVARSARAMCEGLPVYAALAAEIPADARVEMEVDPAEERAAERFVCARLDLAPRVVVARLDGEEPPAGPPASFRLVDRGEGSAVLEELP